MASDPQPPAGQQQDGRQGWSRRALKALGAILRCGTVDGPCPDLSAEIETLRDLASKQLEEDLQQLLSDLIPLAYRICEMRTSHSDQLAAMFRSIVPMITADHPNLAICQRMYVETALLANWQRSCGMRLIYQVGRGRSGSAGLAGMLLALVMAMVPSWLILSQFEPNGGSAPVEQPAAGTETTEPEESADPADEEAEEADRTFQIEERAAENAVVGTLGRPGLDASPIYEIIEGNDDEAFAIDEQNGTLVVADGLLLDHETEPVRRLTLAVTDAELTDTLAVTVMVTDANDPPSLVHHIFVVSEHAGPSTEVGTLTAIDQDEDEILTFGITAGNEAGVFDVNPETGRLRVVQPSALNYDRAPSLTLKIEVSDGDGATNFGTVTVHVTPGKEDPLTPYEREDVFALLMSAFLGSLASIVLSLAATPEAKTPQLYDPATVFIRSFFKPLVAMIFALAVFSVLKTGLVSISGLNVSQGGEIQFHILWVIGFLSGFSERFAPRIFGQVSGGHERPPM